MEESQVHIVKLKKAVWKKSYILYDSNYMTFWKRQKYSPNKSIGGFQGWWGRRDDQVEHGSEHVLRAANCLG